VFTQLNLSTTTKINNRKILQGIAQWLCVDAEGFIPFTITLDKLDKIGLEDVLSSFKEAGWSDNNITKLKNLINFSSTNKDWSEVEIYLNKILGDSEVGLAGLDEISFIMRNLDFINLNNNLIFDITLARGLNYYTGTIFEIISNEMSIGSICGGGRYDDLTALFGLQGLSGVGISFGAERIYDILEKLNRFPDFITREDKILIVNFGENYLKYSLPILLDLHKAGFIADIYPDEVKLKKQFNYANELKFKYVIIIGEDEIANDEVSIKDMYSGEQVKISKNNIISYLKNKEL